MDYHNLDSFGVASCVIAHNISAREDFAVYLAHSHNEKDFVVIWIYSHNEEISQYIWTILSVPILACNEREVWSISGSTAGFLSHTYHGVRSCIKWGTNHLKKRLSGDEALGDFIDIAEKRKGTGDG